MSRGDAMTGGFCPFFRHRLFRPLLASYIPPRSLRFAFDHGTTGPTRNHHQAS